MTVTETTWAAVLRRRRNTARSATLDVCFCNVGQGDCTIVWLPNNELIVVDCGSVRWSGMTPPMIEANLPSLNGAPLPIKALVLTHPDIDHYCLCGNVIKDRPIDTVYHSCEAGRYRAWAFRKWWWDPLVSTIRLRVHLTINATDPDPEPIARADRCLVQAIASDVPAPRALEAYQTNTASVVVKGTYGPDSFLIAADGTCVTEDFLRANQQNVGLNAGLLRVGHHGSQTSSSNDFLTAVGPQVAIISASQRNRYGLPRESVVQRVARRVQRERAGHLIFSYADDNEMCVGQPEDDEAALPPGSPDLAPPEPRSIDRQLWVTGTDGDLAYSFDGR